MIFIKSQQLLFCQVLTHNLDNVAGNLSTKLLIQ